MKIHKKIGVGLVLFVGFWVFLFAGSRALAAPATADEIGNCASLIAQGFGAKCKLVSNGAFPPYGSADYAAFTGSGFQASYNPTGTAPADRIVLTINNIITDPGFLNFVYSSTGTFNPGFSNELKFYIYKPLNNDSNYLLLTNTNNQTPRIYGLVYNQQKDGSGGKVAYAWKVDKLALASTSTGAAITPSPGATDSSCEAISNSSFAWLMCPALREADSAVGAFSGFVDDQLCVNTGKTSSTGGVVCDSKNILGDQTNDGVKKAWSIFRILATSLLVLFMLAIVISQAIGSGPFDAYSVRKMLPKLVIAAIAIQLSWFMLKWAIDISNDLGRGVADLLFQPFGGLANMNLDTLVGANLGTHTVGANNTFAFFAVLAAGGVGILALSIPGLLLMALYVVLAVLTAFIVLILRKLLIIMLVIFAPIALIAWILPGTQKYWKLWSDNFSKVLLMFPMIMGLIAAGRIFAYITSTASSSSGLMFSPHLAVTHLGPLPIPYFGLVTTFIDLAIIILAYFGPYFLIPQTYKWGGVAMGVIGKGTQSLVEKSTKPAKDYLQWRQGLSPWKQARAARKAEIERRSRNEFTERLGAEGLRGRVRRARLGGIAVTPRGRANESEIRGAIVRRAAEAQQKVFTEDVASESARISREVASMTSDDRRIYIRGLISNPNTAESTRHAALKQAIIDRDIATIESYMNDAATSGDPARIAAANRFRELNAGDLSTLAPHILRGDIDGSGLHQGIMRAADDSQENVAQLQAGAVQSILSHLSEQAVSGTTAEIRVAASARLQKFLTTYAAATQNDNVKGSINSGGAAIVREFLDAGAVAAGTPMRFVVDRQVAADAYDSAHAHIDIQPNPTVRQTLAPVAVPATSPVDIIRNNISRDGTVL